MAGRPTGTRCVGREIGDLLPFGREPLKVALPEDSVEHHQPFDGATQRKRPAMPIVGLANGRIAAACDESGNSLAVLCPQRRAVAYLRATSFRKKSCTFVPPCAIRAKAE